MPIKPHIAQLTPSHFILKCGGKATRHDSNYLVLVIRKMGYEWQAPRLFLGVTIIHHAIPEMGRILAFNHRLARLAFPSYSVTIRLSDFIYPEFTSCILVHQGVNYEQL